MTSECRVSEESGEAVINLHNAALYELCVANQLKAQGKRLKAPPVRTHGLPWQNKKHQQDPVSVRCRNLSSEYGAGVRMETEVSPNSGLVVKVAKA
jgi:hypothetical protein